MSVGLGVEGLWIPPRERLCDFLRLNLGLLRDSAGRPASEHFVPKMLVEGLGYSEKEGTLLRIGGLRRWIVSDEDSVQAIVVEEPRSSALGPWCLADVIEASIKGSINWLWLTNGEQWRVYHHSHDGKDSRLDPFLSAALLDGAPVERQAERLLLITSDAVERGTLDDVWELRSYLRPDKIVAAIKSDHATAIFLRELSTQADPDEASFNAVLLSDVGLDAVRTALFDSQLSGLRLPLFVLRAAIESGMQDS